MPDAITCPKCGTHIEVTEVLSSQLREQLRKEFDAEARQKEQDFATREQALRERQAALETSQKTLDSQIEARVAKERDNLLRQAQEKAKEAVALELKDTCATLCRPGWTITTDSARTRVLAMWC